MRRSMGRDDCRFDDCSNFVRNHVNNDRGRSAAKTHSATRA
jgi:hypothetical protein